MKNLVYQMATKSFSHFLQFDMKLKTMFEKELLCKKPKGLLLLLNL